MVKLLNLMCTETPTSAEDCFSSFLINLDCWNSVPIKIVFMCVCISMFVYLKFLSYFLFPNISIEGASRAVRAVRARGATVARLT